MRVVVAGGAGFLGSHLCDRLLGRGDEVIVLDDLSTGSRRNLSHLEADRRFSLAVTDVSACADVAGPLDAVLHLASPASPPAYLARPLATLAAGSEGTRRLLELARAKNARFLLASTSEVYGDPTVHPQSEAYRGNVDPTGPRSVYDEAKRFAEALTMAHHRACGTDVAIARIFNTYGPRLEPGDGRVVSNFITQAQADRPLTIYGEGSQTRALCYVDDQVDGLMALLDSQLVGPVNLGNPEERTVLQIAAAVLEVTGSSSEIAFCPPQPDDPMRRCPDITVAREQLGWSPEIGLEVGLARTAEHFAQLAQCDRGAGNG
jgi:nucleoside-diphosphate-sugar epimerase